MTGGLFPIPSMMDIHDCREMFSQYYVDPNIAQQNVPTKWNGSARAPLGSVMLARFGFG